MCKVKAITNGDCQNDSRTYFEQWFIFVTVADPKLEKKGRVKIGPASYGKKSSCFCKSLWFGV